VHQSKAAECAVLDPHSSPMRLEKLLNWKQCSTLIVVSTNYAIIADGTTLAQMVDFDPMVESECHKQQKYRQARLPSALVWLRRAQRRLHMHR
jgi:hypothetical protein